MAFKAQVSLTDNSIKEKRSVLFIENLLVDKANTDISTEDKKANIDGYIELLSSDKRIVGKITVQVKTVPSNMKVRIAILALLLYSRMQKVRLM